MLSPSQNSKPTAVHAYTILNYLLVCSYSVSRWRWTSWPVWKQIYTLTHTRKTGSSDLSAPPYSVAINSPVKPRELLNIFITNSGSSWSTSNCSIITSAKGNCDRTTCSLVGWLAGFHSFDLDSSCDLSKSKSPIFMKSGKCHYYYLPIDRAMWPFHSYFSYRMWLHTMYSRKTWRYNVLSLAACCCMRVEHYQTTLSYFIRWPPAT